MIRVKIIALGKLKEKYLRDAADEYAKRLSKYCNFEIIEINPEKLQDNPSDREILSALAKEKEAILKKIPQNAYTVALCVEGKQCDSVKFSRLFTDYTDFDGGICFIIGSSYGLSDDIKKIAKQKLSVSEMTFPHQLFRVMLFEQIYRGFKIIEGGTYHK